MGNANGITTHVPAFPLISSSLFSAFLGVLVFVCLFVFSLGICPCCSSCAVQVQEDVEAEHHERTLLWSVSCFGRSVAVMEGNYCGLDNCSLVSPFNQLPVQGSPAVKYCSSANEGAVHCQEKCH